MKRLIRLILIISMLSTFIPVHAEISDNSDINNLYKQHFQALTESLEDVDYHLELKTYNNVHFGVDLDISADYEPEKWDSHELKTNLKNILNDTYNKICIALLSHESTQLNNSDDFIKAKESNDYNYYVKIEFTPIKSVNSKFSLEMIDNYICIKSLENIFDNSIIPESYFHIENETSFINIIESFKKEINKNINKRIVKFTDVDLYNKTVCGIKMGLIEKLSFEFPCSECTFFSDISDITQNVKATIEQVFIPGAGNTDYNSYYYIYSFSGNNGTNIYWSLIPSSYTWNNRQGKLYISVIDTFENNEFIDNRYTDPKTFTLDGWAKNGTIDTLYFATNIPCTNIKYEFYMDSYSYNNNRNFYYLMCDDQNKQVYDEVNKTKLPDNMLTPEQAKAAAGDPSLINYRTINEHTSPTIVLDSENYDKKQNTEGNKNEKIPTSITDKTDDDFIVKLNELGLFKGTDNGYELDKPLTRAEMCALISRILINTESSDEQYINYTDINKEFWAYKDIAKLTASGIINGFEDNTFKPDENVTAEQLAAMLIRATGHSVFTENTDIWYESTMNIAEKYGIFKNVELSESSPLLRGQAVKMYYNALNLPIVQVESVKYTNGEEIPNVVILDGSSDNAPLVTLLSEYENSEKNQ